MVPVTIVLVLLGGAVGAVGRFLVDRAVNGRLAERTADGRHLPWGTFLVNIVGSLLLGVLAGTAGHLPGWIGPLVGTGFCGALTTYSTFTHETFRLAEAPDGRGRAITYAVVTLAAGLCAATLGWLLGEQL